MTCLVAKGFTQVERSHFNHIFSLMVKQCSTSVLMEIMSQYALELKQMDDNLHGITWRFC